MALCVKHAGDALQMRLWIDPGESTGWAAWVTPAGQSYHAGQGPWRDVMTDLDILRLDVLTDTVAVGWESFVVNPGQPADTVALRVIGALEYILYDTPVILLGEKPASHQALGSGFREHIGWHHPGERDTNQATNHLLTDLIVNRLLPDELLLSAVQHGHS